ncbi:MAG: RNA-binding protein [Lysobacter sp.]|nr:RNA-binding protein [Lysobacter sp.]MDQ3270246.1 S4 domain-containing protein [Pseudomonadota bacterium]
MPRSGSSEIFVVRLDQWLWAARFYKTRGLAREAIEGGKVEVGAQRAKPARPVRLNDALRVTRGEETFEVVVAGISDKRGPASEAQTLYVESSESIAERQRLREERIAQRTGYRAPDGKPDKRARRLIRALGDIDAL